MTQETEMKAVLKPESSPDQALGKCFDNRRVLPTVPRIRKEWVQASLTFMKAQATAQILTG